MSKSEEHVDTRIAALETRVGPLKERLDALDTTIDEHRSSLKAIIAQLIGKVGDDVVEQIHRSGNETAKHPAFSRLFG